jgi:hypothetical protein
VNAEALLSRLEAVRQTGAQRWIGRCPAHDDRRPSLSVRELDDGRVLIHCFAGCSAAGILTAVGLNFDALFPGRPIEHGRGVSQPFSALDALRCIAFEATLSAVAASNLAQGTPLRRADRMRLLQAAGRINHALEIALGR